MGMPNWARPNPRGSSPAGMPMARARLELEAFGQPTEMSSLPPSLACAELLGCVAARKPDEDGAGAALRRGRSGLSATIFPGCRPSRDGVVTAQPIPPHDHPSILTAIPAESRATRPMTRTNGRPTPRCVPEATMSPWQGDGRPVGRDNIGGIGGFWPHAKSWPSPYPGARKKFFPLHLGETCYRFNH